jgi:glycosyltransferase involved in cell wall biosynthesis
LRGNLFIPDARVGWKPAVLRAVQDYCSQNKEFTLVTTGPPHSVHLIGSALKKQLPTIKWLADFRDPWTTIGYHKDLKLTDSASRKHDTLEQQTLDGCDALIVTSPHTAAEFSAKTRTPVHVVTNGYDIAVNETIEQPAGKFTLTHTGTLLANRNPQVLWQTLTNLLKNIPDFKEHFELVLAGNVANDIHTSISIHGLSDYVTNKGYVSHNEAVDLLFSSQLLLLVEINTEGTKAIIAGKIFEYLASRRPIVAIGPAGAAIGTIIEENEAGAFFLYDDAQTLYDYIAQKFHAYKADSNVAIMGKNVTTYHRKALTQSLAAIIDAQWES